LENAEDIEKLLEEIDNDQNDLDQFISKEEETHTKNFNHKMSEAERNLQNSRRGDDNSFTGMNIVATNHT